jgi:AcrR family transcriptional regulator
VPSLSPAKPARKRPGRYHHGDLRQSLIHAALRTIDRRGVEALTLRAVGASLGVSRTALYRHFADKDTLLAAVAAEGFRTLHSALISTWEGAGRGLAGFRAQGFAYIAFGTTHPSHYRVMFGGYVTGVAKGSDLDVAGQAAFMALVDALVDLQQQGIFRRDDPVMQARYVWGTVHGVTMLLMAGKMGPQPPAGETLAAYTIDRLIAALRTSNVRSVIEVAPD